MKVLIVDDHQLIREGLKLVLCQLAPGGNVTVLEVEGYPEAIACTDANPDLDLILLDLRLPDVIGFAALIDMQERHPRIPIVIMSGLDDSALVREALERGARGFLPKTSSGAVFLNAIRLVLSGGTYVPKEIISLAGSVRLPLAVQEGRPVTPSEIGLTKRQTDVLALILLGKSNKMICRQLGLSEGTVKNHVAAILKALNVSTRAEAIVASNRMGLHISDTQDTSP